MDRVANGEISTGEPNIKLVPYESFTGRAYQDVRRRLPDVTRCEQILGVKAENGIEEGLLRTIAWQRNFTEAKETSMIPPHSWRLG